MANPNPQLEVALAQFTAQPGTTPDQEAQLRAAIIADTDWLRQLNREAAAGQIKGFALEAPGSAPNLTGIYDKQTGVLTLPATSFQPSGTAASDDLKAVIGLQAMSVDFAYKTYRDAARQTQSVSQDMVSNLQSTLNGSPVLAEQVKEAVKQGHVQHFGLLDGRMAAGATYDGESRDGTPKGINLPPLGLQTNSPANPQGRYDAHDMTFVLGHEIQHGFNDATKDQARGAFLTAIGQQAHVHAPLHDYTDELRGYIQAGREDEAKAEIAGWNALLSREQQNNAHVTLDDMRKLPIGRQHDFVKLDFTSNPPQTVPLPGLTFNPDGSLSQTTANIAAMGQHYFDRPSPAYAQPGDRPVGLGEHKPNPTADYTNYYGTWALEQIAAAEDRANVRHQGARPQIAIDMAGLGLKEDLIEMEGLNLGGNKTPRSYLDTSQTPAAQGRFHHTQDGSVNAQHDHQHVPIAPRTPSPSAPDRHPDEPDHPDRDLLEKLRDGVRQLDQEAGKGWDDASERLAASALVMAKEKGFTAQDELQLAFNKPSQRYAAGDLLHLSRQGSGESPDPVANRSHMTTAEALSKPVSERYQEVEAINITQERTQAMQLSQQQSMSPDDPARAGPVMQM
jgi:hypothetical protein